MNPPQGLPTELDAADINNLWTALDDVRSHALGWANVKEYGAKGNGTTDDTAAIQAALNTGLTVFVPSGTYSVTGLTAVAGGALIGLGQVATIKLAIGANLKALTISVSGFRVSGLRFDGGNVGPYNGATPPGAGTRSGIFVTGPTPQPADITISDCYATGFDLSGLYLGALAASLFDHTLPSIKIRSFTAAVNYNGIFIDALAEYIQLDNCDSTGAFAAIHLIGGNNIFANCRFTNSYRNLLMRTGTNSDHGSFVGCSFNHGAGWPTTFPTIDIASIVNGEMFIGCHFWNADIQVINSHGLILTDCQIVNSNLTINTSTGPSIVAHNWFYSGGTRSIDAKVAFKDNFIDASAGPVVLPYSASIAIDGTAGEDFSVTPTNGTAFTINNPTNPSFNERLSIRVVNTFGTLGAVTLGTAFKFTGAPTFPAVPNGSNLQIAFRYNGTNYVEETRTGNVPN